jgi:micrococcal nuclease
VRLAAALAAAALLAAPASAGEDWFAKKVWFEPEAWYRVREARGPMLMVLADGTRVRLIGVKNAALPKAEAERFHAEGKAALNALVRGRRVRLFHDQQRTRQGAQLAYVYLEDGTFVNARMVADGWLRGETQPPNVKYQVLLDEAERQARQAKRGIWRWLES